MTTTTHARTGFEGWRQWLGAALVALAAAAASGAAWADPPGRVGRVAETQGNVWIFDDEQGEWIEARRNRPVTAGDRLSLERGARAEVQVGSATLRLDGGSELEFTRLDDERVRMRLHGGSLAMHLRSNEHAREFDVLTEEGRFDATRAGRYRIDRERDGSFAAVFAGAMHFEASDSALTLNAGQRAEFWVERGITHYAWVGMPDDRFGEWVAREEREAERNRNRYVSPEMTGADELDRYGDWDRHPEYGSVWYPRVVIAGWAPYRYGRWAWVSPWGWTWVDDAPWGFAPFHYGRWVYWSGRWGWAPGRYVARPVYAPALVAWVGGANFSVGINLSGPAVGWVPLAPREVYYPSYQVTNVYVRNVNVTHREWHGPKPRYERTVPTGPIMYTNQGVAGGVTVVPSDVLRQRQPVGGAAVKPGDSRTVAPWQQQAVQPMGAPAAPTLRPAPPQGQVPAAPGAARPAPWSPPGRGNSAIGAREGDGGRAERPRVPAAPAQRMQAPMAQGPGVQAPAPQVQGAQAQPRVEPTRPDMQAPPSGRARDEQRPRGRDRDEEPRRVAPAQQQPVMPAQVARPNAQMQMPVPPQAQGQPPAPPRGHEAASHPGKPPHPREAPQRARERDDGPPRGGDKREQQNR